VTPVAVGPYLPKQTYEDSRRERNILGLKINFVLKIHSLFYTVTSHCGELTRRPKIVSCELREKRNKRD
jgi:hypothetical protein